MPLTYERLPSEPIIIFTFTGYVTAEDQREAYRISAKFLDETPGERLYRVSNYLAVQSSFAEVMGIARDVNSALPGSSTDPRVTAVIVGQHQWTRLAVDLVKQPAFGGLQLALFNSIEDGLTAIRLVIRELKRAEQTQQLKSKGDSA